MEKIPIYRLLLLINIEKSDEKNPEASTNDSVTAVNDQIDADRGQLDQNHNVISTRGELIQSQDGAVTENAEKTEEARTEEQKNVAAALNDGSGDLSDAQGVFIDNDNAAEMRPTLRFCDGPAAPELCATPSGVREKRNHNRRIIRQRRRLQEDSHVKESRPNEPDAYAADNRRALEEERILKNIPKPIIRRLNKTTFIYDPRTNIPMLPYFLRPLYPGFVRDIEVLEGSHDPALCHINPPILLSERPDDTDAYPMPYVGEHPPLK